MSGGTEKNKDGFIKKLDTNTSSAIRKTQIITKVSDVVRELVDNSVDGESSTIQVLLEDFGFVKIEVRDTGCGIAQSDFQLAFSGGYTSKLKDCHHLSSNKQYGFRGEALASICSIANVTVTTKTHEESQGRKYVLDKLGQIISESKAAVGTGTSITIRDLFCNFPVRKKFISGNKQKLTELKDIERYLKAMAIANHKIHLSLYHDGNLSWTKPSVSSVDQALVTVLGVVTAKKLTRCGPVYIHNEDDVHGRKGTMELFLPRKPIDYKTMSYTDHKVAMFIFVNRRRVDIREFEKMIQRYAASASEKPAPADNHRFPISVLLINLPPKEVDFNRDMDKSKVFLTDKDEIVGRLEEMLKKFYEVDLSTNPKASEMISSKQKSNNNQHSSPSKNDTVCAESSSNDSAQKLAKKSVLAADTIKPLENREDTILAFLENIPTTSEKNFSLSPIKNLQQSPNKTVKSCVLRDATKESEPSSSLKTTFINKCLVSEKERKLPDKSNEHAPMTYPSKSTTVSNFDVNLSLDFLDDTQQPPEKKSRFEEIEKDKWVQGRMEDKFGGIIENVAIVRGPMTSDRISKSADDSIPVGNTKISLAPGKTGIFGNQRSNVTPGRFNSISKEPIRSSASFFSKPASSTTNNSQLCLKGRQVTLDSFRNWKTSDKPSTSNLPGMFSHVRSETIDKNHTFKNPESSRDPATSLVSTTGLDTSPENSIGVISPSVKDYLANKVETTKIVSGLQKTIHSSQFFSTSSQRGPEEIRAVLPRLIGLLPGTRLYLAKVDGFLGVFNPKNFLEMCPEIKEKYADSATLKTSEHLTEDRISTLLIDFVSENSYKTDVGQKIFHVLTDLDVSEFEPRISSTHYSI